jgi:hypothetical protein
MRRIPSALLPALLLASTLVFAANWHTGKLMDTEKSFLSRITPKEVPRCCFVWYVTTTRCIRKTARPPATISAFRLYPC